MKILYSLILLTFIGLSVNAQVVYIPDSAFRAFLLGDTTINTNKDTAIQVSEAAAYNGSISVSALGISDLTGIEAFTSITGLDCSGNNLTALDVSFNNALDSLTCDHNTLASLNVSSDTALSFLGCEYNSLTSLDLSSNIARVTLWCYNNNLTSLNISTNVALNGLDCSDNNLTNLNVSANTALIYIACSANSLTTLNASYNTALTTLYCSYNNLTSLNIKNGNNGNINDLGFDATNNDSLTCIEVDSAAYSANNWTYIDSWASFSTNCNYVPVNEVAGIKGIIIYPNPVLSQLTIETNGRKAESIKLYNAFGDIVYSQNSTDSRIRIDIQAVPAGIYFLPNHKCR